jgi:hypothetical protein
MRTLVKTKIKNTNKKSKTKTQKKTQKGGIHYLIGNVNKDRNGYTQSKNLSNNFTLLSNKIEDNQSLPNLHITNLEMVSVFPNKDNNFIYHSLFIAQIDKNISGELDTIHWSITKFINDLLNKLNLNSENNNPNNVKYGLKDIKINDFKFEIKNEINTIIISGNVYISNINKLNLQIENNVYDKMPDDTNNIIKEYMTQKNEKQYNSKK